MSQDYLALFLCPKRKCCLLTDIVSDKGGGIFVGEIIHNNDRDISEVYDIFVNIIHSIKEEANNEEDNSIHEG